MIICLSGFARSGKDTVADILVEQGFKKVAFADKLRECLYALNPPVAPSKEHGGMIFLQEVIDVYGWENYKGSEYGQVIRELLQRMGTEAGREVLGYDIWVDATLNDINLDNVVISDGRFFNEFDAVVERGGQVWRVERPGIGPANEHRSETEAVLYPNFTLIINNDGTLEDLKNVVIRMYQGHRERYGG